MSYNCNNCYMSWLYTHRVNTGRQLVKQFSGKVLKTELSSTMTRIRGMQGCDRVKKQAGSSLTDWPDGKLEK